MSMTHGAQTVQVYMDKHAVKSSAVGHTNVEEIKWLTKTLVSSAAAWKSTGWAYICDISHMSPVTPDVSQELVNLHKELAAANCKAIAFVDGSAIFTAAQAKTHQKQSHSAFQEGHFKTEDDALAWIATIIR
ncbi:MAG: hypothetical protein IJD85_08780 [Oscillospiraceae bacterium]|nr:hypothetical protein [Oscillospiraceae bacterium]